MQQLRQYAETLYAMTEKQTGIFKKQLGHINDFQSEIEYMTTEKPP